LVAEVFESWSQIQLLGFSLWQLCINFVAITTDCCYGNVTDLELPSSNDE